MKRYLAIPQNDAVVAALSLADVSVDPDRRLAQVAQVKAARQALGAQTRGPDPVTIISNYDAEIIAHPEETTAATGVAIFDMEDAEEFDSLRSSLPQYNIVEDKPLSLIAPKQSLSPASAFSTEDLWHLEAIMMKAARSNGFSGTGKGVGVAVLDTGMDEVNELKNKIRSSYRLDRSNYKVIPTAVGDTHGHGTHVAGLIAGTNVGVATNVDLMNYIMLPNTRGNVSDFIFALDFVAQQPEIAIVNISAGVPGYDSSMKPSVALARRMGVFPVIAIGNDGPNTSRSPGNYAEVLSVGASNSNGKIWSSSSSGNLVPDALSYMVPGIVAPGEDVTSCVTGGGYDQSSGSSMATPLVAGIAALIVEKFPDIGIADLHEEIISSAAKLPTVADVRQGAGLLQLPNSLWLGT